MSIKWENFSHITGSGYTCCSIVSLTNMSICSSDNEENTVGSSFFNKKMHSVMGFLIAYLESGSMFELCFQVKPYDHSSIRKSLLISNLSLSGNHMSSLEFPANKSSDYCKDRLFHFSFSILTKNMNIPENILKNRTV